MILIKPWKTIATYLSLVVCQIITDTPATTTHSATCPEWPTPNQRYYKDQAIRLHDIMPPPPCLYLPPPFPPPSRFSNHICKWCEWDQKSSMNSEHYCMCLCSGCCWFLGRLMCKILCKTLKVDFPPSAFSVIFPFEVICASHWWSASNIRTAYACPNYIIALKRKCVEGKTPRNGVLAFKWRE